MNARRSMSMLVLATLLLWLTAAGCSRAKSDAQIAGEVVTKINADANVPTKQITVTSNGGVVTLAGTVTSDAERAAIANDAAQVAGVKTVVNNLEVGQTTAAAAPPPQEQPQAEEPAPARRESRPARRVKPARERSSVPVETASSAPPASVTPAPTPAVVNTPPPPPAPPKPVTIPDGTMMSIRMIDAVDTGRNQAGDTFRATLDSPITIDDKVVIPQGADITGVVSELKGGGKFTGKPELALELTSLSMNGRKYSLHTNQYTREGSSRGKNTAAKVGGGAALGAIIGGLAGGGKGAAIGATVGAGAGGGVQAASKAPQVKVPSEALLSFRLESPITVTPVSSVNRHSRQASTQAVEYNDTSSDQQYTDSSQSSDQNPPVLKRRDQ